MIRQHLLSARPCSPAILHVWLAGSTFPGPAPKDRELALAVVTGRHLAPIAALMPTQKICGARSMVLDQRKGRLPSHDTLPSKRFGVSSRPYSTKDASSAGCGKVVSGLARETPWVPEFSLQIAIS